MPSDARIPVLINADSGKVRADREGCGRRVEAAFAAAGLTAIVTIVPGAALPAAAARLAGQHLVVVGGGDGTLGGAAGALAGRSTLAILPLGTRNHLARELGIPLGLGEAVQLIADGATRRIDIAHVNGRAFVNNASIGLYPKLVRLREEQQARGWPKAAAALHAAAVALKRVRHHRLRLSLPGGAHDVVTPMLFVGNNRYQLRPGRFGRRVALDGGTLSIYAVARNGRTALVGLALRLLVGRADPARDFAALGDATTLTVQGHARDIAIALDGERTRLTLPLRFEAMPGALTVIAPPA